MDRELQQEIDKTRQRLNLAIRIGYLGDGSGSGDPHLHDGSGRFWVRFKIGNRFTPAVALPMDTNANVPPNDNIAVEIGDVGGVQGITRVYREGYKQSGTNPAVTNPLDPQAHGDISSSSITQFQCKRHADTITKPLTVVVLQGYVKINSTARVFLGEEADLTSFVPAAGEKCIAVVFLKSDMTLEVFASTPKLITDPILETDIDECLQQASAGSIEIWGWVLQDGQTILTEDPTQNIDLRPEINAPSVTGGSGSTGDYILIRDQKAQNTQGGTFTSGAWQTRVLNTEVSDAGGHASLSSNQITLAAGTYRVNGRCPARLVDQHQARLYNITDAATTLLGTSEYSPSAVDTPNTCSIIMGEFTIAGSKVFELQHRCTTTRASDGFGTAANFDTEIYSIIELIKV